MRIIVLFLLAFTVNAQIPTTGLVGGWPFSGNANDMSGSGNHGSVSNATLITDRFGVANSAYQFNGSNSSIIMLNAGPTGTISCSVSFWYKSTTSNIGVCFGYGGASGQSGIFQLLVNSNCIGIGFDNSNSTFMRGGSSVNNGQWQHAVVVYDASLGNAIGNIKFYVNGQLLTNYTCGSTGTNSAVNSNAVHPITIGMTADSYIRHFTGGLDDFYLYNRALTSNEVTQLYTVSCPAPSPPVSITGNTNVCTGSAQVFSVASNSTATSYVWSLPGGWTGTSTTNVISVIPSASGLFSVAAINSCGQSSVLSQSVSVKPLPVISISSQTNNISCGIVTVTLTAGGASNYTWSNGSIGSLLNLTLSATSNYSVTGTDNYGCTGKGNTVISISSTPSVILNVMGPGPACEGVPVSLASQGANTYTWQPGNLNGFFVTVTPSVTTTYTVTGKDLQTGCANTSTYTQQVLHGPTVTAVASSTVICDNETATLSASGSPSYIWQPINATGPNVFVNPATTTSYTLSGSPLNGCKGIPAVITVSVKPAPVITISTNHSVACIGELITLGVNGALNYTWQPGNLTGFLINVNPSTTTTYTIVGENSNNCKSTKTFIQGVQNCSALDEFSDKEGVLIYPNPCIHSITLKLKGEKQIRLTDMLGQVLLIQEVSDQAEIDLSQLNSGAYLLNAVGDSGKIVMRKIIKL